MLTGGDLTHSKLAVAWMLMMSAVAIHVFDETITNFLPFYNELVLEFRERFRFFPFPTFTFGMWLGGLIAAIVIGFALTPIVKRGGVLIRVLVIVLGIIMITNALGHILGSIYFGRLLPGFWSSPLLLLSAAFVVVKGFGAEETTR